MKRKLSLSITSFFMAALVFLLYPMTTQAATMDRADWGIDELNVIEDANGIFSSFHTGHVDVSKSGCYYVDIKFKVVVTRTEGNVKVLLNDACMNLCGTSVPSTSAYYDTSQSAFFITFQGPADVYYPTCAFTLRLNWTYNTVNTDKQTSVIEDTSILNPEISVTYGYDGKPTRYTGLYFDRDYKVTTNPVADKSVLNFHAEPVAAAGAYGNRLNYLGPIGYANGNQTVVDSIKDQSDKAHSDSLAEQQLQQDANDLQDKNNQLVDKNNQLLDDTMNGYDDSTGNAANDKLNSSLDSLDNAQSGITDGALSDLDSYTLSPTGVLGYAVQFGQTFSLVASMLQSIYTSAGNFNIIISVVFTLTISCMLLGLAKFFMR